MTIIPDLPNLVLEDVEIAESMTLTLRSIAHTAACPSCGTASSRVQSRYSRTLRDLPASGRQVRLVLQVRRFFCHEHTCPRKVFAESFPELCRPYAQRTGRLQALLCQLGLECGGQVGSRIAQYGQMSGSRDTILRLVRRHPAPLSPPAQIVGLDDFAWRRGYRYGTLICDLERGYPIDLLPDRSVATVSAWLRQHPQIDVVSRDGSPEYAAAITHGAPHAQQVSDRWHLVRNLARCVSAVMAQCLAEIRHAARGMHPGEINAAMQEHARLPRSSPAVHQAQQARQAERAERYAQIQVLHNQGMRSEDIAEHVGMTARTVRRWLAHGKIPSHTHRWHRAPRLDPYKVYLLERWQAGCHNRLQLFREVQVQGYHGSPRTIYRYLETVLDVSEPRNRASATAHSSEPASLPHHELLSLSVQQATWLLFRRPDELAENDRRCLALLQQASPLVAGASHLVATFLGMVRERQGEHLETWLTEARSSHLAALAPFIASIDKDKAAILAGLTLPWNNGRLEGHVNRLKLLKRQGYGRAKFDLLRLRVLHHAEPKSAISPTSLVSPQQRLLVLREVRKACSGSA